MPKTGVSPYCSLSCSCPGTLASLGLARVSRRHLVRVIAATVSLRDKRVESKEQADSEETRGVVNGVAEGDCADGFRAEAADHDVVDHALRHPAQFAQHHRDCEHKHRAQFPSPFGLWLSHCHHGIGESETNC